MARRDFRQLGLADSIVRREQEERVARPLGRGTRLAGAGDDRGRVYASREGGLAYPLLTYIKLLLLQQWYGLSDQGLEAAVDDRLSFRRFAGIPLSESVPDHILDLALPGGAGRGAAWPRSCWPRSTGSWTRRD